MKNNQSGDKILEKIYQANQKANTYVKMIEDMAKSKIKSKNKNK